LCSQYGSNLSQKCSNTISHKLNDGLNQPESSKKIIPFDFFYFRPIDLVPSIFIQGDFEEFREQHKYPQGENLDLAIRPRNLAGVIEVSKLLTSGNIRYCNIFTLL